MKDRLILAFSWSPEVRDRHPASPKNKKNVGGSSSSSLPYLLPCRPLSFDYRSAPDMFCLFALKWMQLSVYYKLFDNYYLAHLRPHLPQSSSPHYSIEGSCLPVLTRYTNFRTRIVLDTPEGIYHPSVFKLALLGQALIHS